MFACMPLAALVSNFTLILHGGLFRTLPATQTKHKKPQHLGALGGKQGVSAGHPWAVCRMSQDMLGQLLLGLLKCICGTKTVDVYPSHCFPACVP